MASLTMEKETETKKLAEYEDIFKYVKPFGTYQKLVVFGSCLLALFGQIQYDQVIFVTAVPKFQCSTPNVTCGGINKCCTNCTSYEFDPTYTTVASEWNLICDRSYLAAIIQSMFFVGMLVGSFVSGILSDAIGRKPVLFFTVGASAISGIAQSFVHIVPLFAVLRFFNGAFVMALFLTQYVHMVEMIGEDYRTRMCYVNNLNVAAGAYFSILIGYFTRDWQSFSWISSIPILLLFLFWCVFPESPRWLAAKGKLKQAHQIIMKYGGKDNKPCDPAQMMALLESIHDDQEKRNTTVKRYTPLDLVRTPKLRRWTIISALTWFTLALIVFGMYMYMTQLHGSLYTNLTLFNTLWIALVFPAWLSMNRLGRRLTTSILFGLTGILLLLIFAVPNDNSSAITYLAIFGQVISNQLWAAVYLVSTEIFPTVLRNTAIGLNSTAARIAGIAASFILMLAQLPGSSIILPITIFGVCALVCAIASLWLPETAMRPLYQTTAEAEENPEDYGIPFLRKRKASRYVTVTTRL